MRSTILVLLFYLSGFASIAQAKDDSAGSPAQKIKEKFLRSKDSIDGKMLNQDTLISQARQLSDEQFRTMLVLEKQKQEQVADDNFAMRHRWRSFNFQYTASVVIFILVIIIVLAGLFFSGWQFSFTLKQLKLKEQAIKVAAEKVPAATTPAVAAGADAQPVAGEEPKPVVQQPASSNTIADLNTAFKNDLELSTTGVKVNSSVLGVIILVLSIAFFYLYIMYVYPIKYISPQPVPATTEAPADNK